MEAPDPFKLDRFVSAQADIWTRALDELKRGRKQSHWMWFMFPQLRGLGLSATSVFYGIGSLGEARAYLNHPLLGQRLVLLTRTVLDLERRDLKAIFGSPDDMKFCSSMTLFALAAGKDEDIFQRALDRYCGGEMDGRTLAQLA